MKQSQPFTNLPLTIDYSSFKIHHSPVTYKETFYFTGQCLSLDEHPEFREQIIEQFADACNIQNSTFNIQNFVQLCSDHLVIPAIYLKLKAHGLLGFIPEEVVQAFAEIYELNRERNLQILRQIDDITALLNKENIQPVFLKGTANLLDGLYSDVGERMIGDIDFLVSEEDFLKTGALLENNGYCHGEKISYVDFTSRKHYPGLHKNGEPAEVEIHRIVVSDRYSAAILPETVIRDKKPVSGKHEIFVPSNAHKLTHTFAHDQLEDSGYAYKLSGFRGMYDLYLLSKRMSGPLLNDQIRYHKQAVSWLVFSQRVLGLPGRFYPVETRSAKWFCLKYDFSMSFIRIYNAWTFLKKMVYLIVYRYIGGFLKAIFLKKERTYLTRRLSHAVWYREHWEHYKSYFS
jgi:hypothetical protein